MAEQKLNLLKFSACCPTEASACPAQVMGCQPIVADSRSEFFDDVPNQFLGHSVAPGLARAVRCIRYRTTTVLLNDSRGSEQYQSTNSSMA